MTSAQSFAPKSTSAVPVLVGVGVASQRFDDPKVALEPIALMAVALQRAIDDAGNPAIVQAAQSVAVPKGMWSYRDPARILIDQFGCSDARSALYELGVLQPSPFRAACAAIAADELEVAVVVGGEAKYRSLRAAIAGVSATETQQPDNIEPDDYVIPSVDVLHPIEIARGLAVPARQYAMLESAMRSADGLSMDRHADRLNALWSGFNAVAVDNPDAWNRSQVNAVMLDGTSDTNPLLAAPYTKLHCSQWNVDQASAFILCSQAAAARFGVPRSQWVFPHTIVESNFMTPVVHRRDLHRSPAMRLVGEALSTAIGHAVSDATYLDLYSCFPAAVQLQMREMGVAAHRSLTLTGGMAFGGGPLNNYSFQALAKLVALLRDDALLDAFGVVTAVSGMVTKFGASAWSRTPPASGFSAVDVSEPARAATPLVDVDADYCGSTIVAGYTVAYEKGVPFEAIAIVDTPEGLRSIAQSTDAAVVAAFTEDEWVGATVQVNGPEITSV